LKELLGDFGEEEICIRPGEKMHEVLINAEEMRDTWEEGSTYAILNTSLIQEDRIKSLYPKMKKVKLLNQYSSDMVEKISKSELKEIIKQSGFLD